MKIRDFLHSLRFQLLAIVLLCWLIPTLILGQFMGTIFFNALQEKTEAAVASEAEHAQDLVARNLNRAVTLAKDLTYDEDVTSAVSYFEDGSYAYADFYRITRNYLDRKYSREALFTFSCFFRINQPDELIYNSGYLDAAQLQQDVLPNIMEIGHTLDTRSYFYSQDQNIYLVRNLYNLRMERFGMLVLGINQPEIFGPLYSAGDTWQSQVAIHLNDFSSDQTINWDETPQGFSQDDLLLYFAQQNKQWDFNLGYRIALNRHLIYSQMETFQQLMSWMFVLLIPVCLGLMLYFQRRILKPVALLSDATQRMRRGELGITVPMRGPDELGQLGAAFSSMSTQIQNLVERSYKEEIMLRDARIQAMQSRINPHFINNALEMINWQARMDQNEAIGAMIESLSVLLNASMDRGNQRLTTLRHEIEIAQAYFYFVKSRFGDKLSVIKEINPELDQDTLMLPRLLIQTLLENAIEHGIAPAGGGFIRLNIFAVQSLLKIEVLNNGYRLTAEDLARIQEFLRVDAPASSGHMGLRNISQRLRLMYDGRASVKLTQDNHGDTLATITLPLDVVTTQSETTNHILQ